MTVATDADDEIRERILTGYKDGKPFTPYLPTVALPPVASVLDFGCGLGRNFPYLKTIARSIAAFDLPPMVDQCRQAAGDAVDLLSSDWRQLTRLRFDLVFASLVLQHVEPQPVRAYLRDFSCMAPAVYLLTRSVTDFDENILNVIADLELFEPGECAEVDHDPGTHQVRVLRTLSFDDARSTRDNRHFELVLTARRRS